MKANKNESGNTRQMKKEIKFRVWDKELNRYIELSHHKQAVLLTEEGVEMSTGYDSYDHPTFGVKERQSYKEFDEYQERFTYEQYTRVKDKNGVEIYENDIIEDERGDTYRVYELSGCFAIKNNYWSEDKSDLGVFDDLILMPLCDNQTWGYITEQCKVIGNTKENPELLQLSNQHTKK